MFTGIIEELGTLAALWTSGQSARVRVKASKVLEGTMIGDSIAVNGVCLTVVKMDGEHFEADVMPETVAKTSLKSLRPGDVVNLERAVTPTSRMGGHFVQGHVDGVGVIEEIRRADIAILVRIKTPPALMKYIVAKGSIAIDGISLTVVEVAGDTFSVSLIPHTAHETNLGARRPGDMVNLETDILGRYVERLLSFAGNEEKQRGKTGLSLEFLRENGF